MTKLDFTHKFKAIEGIRLHYVTCGNSDGTPVILLAGFPESWYAWRKVMPLLGKNHPVIALDLPGQGDSDKPYDGYDTKTLASRVHDLLTAVGLTHYCLAAHDVGAWVAFPYAAMFGNEIERLVLLDAGIPGVTFPDMLPADPKRSWRTWHFPFHAIPDLPEVLIEGKERVYLNWFLRRKTANPFSFSEADIDEYVRIFQLPGALRAGMAYYRAFAQSAEQNRVLASQGKLEMPVLAVSADYGSIPDMAGPLKACAARVEGTVIADCGHFVPEEQPEELANRLMAFFGKAAPTLVARE
jgi:pimeloyl-ACP methyl ester carboxylesterase